MIGMSPMNGIVSWCVRLVGPEEAREEIRLAVLQADVRRDRPRADDGWVCPADGHRPFRAARPRLSLSVTSLLWCTRGSTSILMPTSWYWNDVTGDDDRAADPSPPALWNVVDGDRHLVADQELRLLPLRDPQLRLGEQLRVRVVLDEVSDAEGIVKPKELIEICLSWSQVNWPAPTVGAEVRDARSRARAIVALTAYGVSWRPSWSELVRVDLEQLDVDDDLGELLVVLLDDPLGHGDLVGGVAQRDRVLRLVDRDARRLEQRAQGVGDLGDVPVGEEERPDDEVLVGLAVLRRVGGDQDRLLVDDLVEVVLLAQERLERLLELDVESARSRRCRPSAAGRR